MRCVVPIAVVQALALAGCIIVPVPAFDSGNSRTNVERATALRFAAGTPREAVLLALGEPDAVSRDEHALAYRREKVVAIWAAGMGAGATGGTINSESYVVFVFDGCGRLQHSTPERFLGDRDASALLRRVAGPPQHLEGTIEEFRASLLAGARTHSEKGRLDAHWVGGTVRISARAIEFRSDHAAANADPWPVADRSTLLRARIVKEWLATLLVLERSDGSELVFAVSPVQEDGRERETIEGRVLTLLALPAEAGSVSP